MRFLKKLILLTIIFSCILPTRLFAVNTSKGETFVVNLGGGLGNQMFFLAGQVAYAKQFKKDICLARETSLVKLFDIPYPLCSEDEKFRAGKKKCAFERYSPSFLENGDCLMLQGGCLQNERFFSSWSDDIKKLFRFVHPLPSRLKHLENEINNTNSVSIHIRRGDYLQHPETYPIMSLNYYESGADYIQNMTEEPIHLFVFSNDTHWVKQNFKSKYPFTIVSQNSDIEDLHLMTLCKHNIIANSTFSWWGAYLNKNPNKIVIAPSKWNNVDTWWGEEIILKDWVVLPTD